MKLSEAPVISTTADDQEKRIKVGFSMSISTFRNRLVAETKEGIPSEAQIAEYFNSWGGSEEIPNFLLDESKHVFAGLIKILLSNGIR